VRRLLAQLVDCFHPDTLFLVGVVMCDSIWGQFRTDFSGDALLS
jgi:hypothetical protein